jgi:hypothetical protein
LAIRHLLDTALAGELPDFQPAPPGPLPLRARGRPRGSSGARQIYGEPPPRPPKPPKPPADPKYARRRAKTLLRDAIIRLDARVDKMMATEPAPESAARPELSPEFEQRLLDAEEEIRRRTAPPPPPEPEPVPEPEDPDSPNLWASEKAWLAHYLPGGLTPALSQQLTEAFNIAKRVGIERGSEAYFTFLKLRTGLTEPRKRRKKNG